MLSIEGAIDEGLKKFVNKQEELLGVQGILNLIVASRLPIDLKRY
jgi:hypothetical protein